MDFNPPASVLPLVARVTRFVDEELIARERQLLSQSFRQSLPLLHELRQKVKKEGLWAPFFDKAWGGMGLSLVEMAFVSEALGRSPLGHYVFGCQAPDVGNMELLHSQGTDAQRERFLKPLAQGNTRSCFAMTEPDRPGSNPTWMETRAVRDGDHYVIDGHKWFTTGADGAAFTIVMAVTDPDAPLHARASMILVPMDTPGVKLVRNISIMGEEGSDWASHAEVTFTGVRVPVSHRIGEEGMGFMLAQERLGPGRIHHCMRWLGICKRAYGLLVERAVTREVSPGKPLGTRQMVQEWIAKSRMEIHGARLMVLHAAWRIEHEGAHAARDEVSLIKVQVARVLSDVLDRAIQAHGALGVTDDTPLATWYRHERAARIYDGADEVHLASIARRELRAAGLEIKS